MICKYSDFKESGYEAIGKIPKHWQLKRLRYLGKCQNGISKDAEYFGSGDPFVSYGDIYNNESVPFKVKGKAMSSPLDQVIYSVHKGDVFFTRTSETIEEIGIASTCLKTVEKATFSGFLIRFRPDRQDLIPAYSKYYFRSDIHRSFFTKEMNLVTRASLNQDLLKNTPVLIPNKDEQIAIANFLDMKTEQIDSLIIRKKEFSAILEEKQSALITHIISKGLSQKCKMKDSGVKWVSKIPAKWDISKIKYCSLKIGSGVTPKGGADVYQDEGIPLLRSQNIYFDSLRLNDVAHITPETHESMSNSHIKDGDVLLNISGASIGRCNYVPKGFGDGNVNQHVCIIRPNNRITTKFLYYFLNSDLGQKQILSVQNGASREGLNFFDLKNFYIGVPDRDEQIKITEFLDHQTAQIRLLLDKVQVAISKLQEYRNSLITSVVTGKIKVQGDKRE